MTNHKMILVSEYENEDQLYECDTCDCALFKHTDPFRVERMRAGDINATHQIGPVVMSVQSGPYKGTT